jgi:ribosome recycling factor
MIEKIKKEAESHMNDTIDFLRDEFKGIRTGRANIAILDTIKPDAYGSGKMPLNQLATLSTPDPKTIVIEPWDKSIIQAIEKEILSSSLGLNPQNDGKIIRIPIPPLTEERRKEFVKFIKKKAEEAKISIRNVRREANDKLKDAEKNGEISEDEEKRAHDKIQEITDKFVHKIDDLTKEKEQELMEV